MHPPKELKNLQKWFGSIISCPLNEDQTIQTLTPSLNKIEEEANFYIQPTKDLPSHKRIEIYNQQYWWRFFTILQGQYPLLLRLFGYADFNQSIATPYLTYFPSRDYSLKKLGNKLPLWIKTHYNQEDKKLILRAATIDAYFHRGFLAKTMKGTLLQNKSEHEILQLKWKLQPSVFLLHTPSQFLEFRELFLAEEPSYWIENPFPLLEKKESFYLIFRNNQGHMEWQNLDKAAYLLLRQFKTPTHLSSACGVLEKDENLLHIAETHIEQWLKFWIENPILYAKN